MTPRCGSWPDLRPSRGQWGETSASHAPLSTSVFDVNILFCWICQFFVEKLSRNQYCHFCHVRLHSSPSWIFPPCYCNCLHLFSVHFLTPNLENINFFFDFFHFVYYTYCYLFIAQESIRELLIKLRKLLRKLLRRLLIKCFRESFRENYDWA